MMFELFVQLDPFSTPPGGMYITDTEDYMFRDCDRLNVSNVTISLYGEQWVFKLVFDCEEDRTLFIKKHDERIKVMEDV